MAKFVNSLLMIIAVSAVAPAQSSPGGSDFLRAIAANPRDPRPHTGYGIFLMRQQQFSEAIAQFTIALDLDPRSPDAAHNLGLALLQGDRAREALEVLDKHAATTAEYYALRGVVLNALGREGEAVPDLRRAVALDPDNPDALYDLALTLAKTGADPEAAALLKRGRERFPRVAKLHAASGMLAYAAGQNEEAIRAYEAAVRIEPKAADLHASLGDVYSAADAQDKAGAAYAQSVRLDPATPAYYVKYGRSLLKSRDPRKAEAMFRQALARDPANAGAHFELGKLLSAINATAAITHFERAVASDPSLKAAWYQLSLRYRAAGHEDKAREAREQFQKLP